MCIKNKSNRFLFLSKERNNSYGISTGLFQSSLFIAKYLKEEGITTEIKVCFDANSIDKYIHEFKPTHIIIHAIWVTPTKLAELVKKYPKIKWNIRIHSKLPFLSNEGNAIQWISEYLKLPNVKVSTNNEEATKQLCFAIGKPILCLPNIYDAERCKVDKVKKGRQMDIGCFGAIRPLKNILLQAAAAVEFGNRKKVPIRFHINSARTEQGGENTLKNIKALFARHEGRHELVEHLWSPYEEFLKLVGTMDLGMQVSLSETFNIVTADFVKMDIPIVVSREIEWMNEKAFVDQSSIEDIVKTMISLCNPWRRMFFKMSARMHLNNYIKKSKRMWLDYATS